ncbi:MAG: TIGR01777 family protein [Myxococcales bacterium]|nr:TIGR01777 family protein [Myxococcales bacterium]
MRVFVSGATGMIGRALVLRLGREGPAVDAGVRARARAHKRLGGAVELVELGAPDAELATALGRADAVVSLAGEPVADRRWTEARKRALHASRVEPTERLVAAMASLERRPRVLVSASAVGIYGDRGDEELGEESPAGDDFLAGLCRAWEAAAGAAEPLGVRVVALRIGVVLARDGGALGKMLPLFRAGLGGPLGSGRQYLPWIHLDDVVEVAVRALSDERYRGPVHVTAPEPVTSRDFARALGQAVGRRAWLPVPAFALRVAMGRAADMVLGGQRARPQALARLGYHWLHPELGAALADAVDDAKA